MEKIIDFINELSWNFVVLLTMSVVGIVFSLLFIVKKINILINIEKIFNNKLLIRNLQKK